MLDRAQNYGNFLSCQSFHHFFLALTTKGGQGNPIEITDLYVDRYGKEAIKKADLFIEEGGKIMNELAALCKEFNIEEPKKVFCFNYSEGKYELFIDYEALLSACKNDSNTIINGLPSC